MKTNTQTLTLCVAMCMINAVLAGTHAKTRRTAQTRPALAAATASAPQAASAISAESKTGAHSVKGDGQKIEPMLRTHWSQRGAYAEFTPDHNRLGCWSVAFAQILYHHQLVPFGQHSYQGSKHQVQVDFDKPKVDLTLVTPQIKADTPPSVAHETARYVWYTAAATGADFGSGNYVGKSGKRRQSIEQHYGVRTEVIQFPKSPKTQVEDFVRGELSGGRPLFLYMTGSKPGLGHAVVIDGVEGKDDDLKVHINFGWGGRSDGWYSFWSPINQFDHPNRWVLAIRKSAGQAAKEATGSEKRGKKRQQH